MAATVSLLKKRPDAINSTSCYQAPASSEKPNRIFGVKSNRQRHSWRSCGCCCCRCRRPAVVSWRGLHRLIFGASPDCGLPDPKATARSSKTLRASKPPGASAQSHLPSAIRPRFTNAGSRPALIIILFGQWDVQSGSVTSLFT